MEDLKAPMIFDDLEPIEVPVTIGSRKYVLREGDTGVVMGYRNLQLQSLKIDNEGNPVGVVANAEWEIYLVSRCLFRKVDDNGKLSPVTEAEVRAMNPKVSADLFDRAKAITPGLMRDTDPDKLEQQIDRLKQQLERIKAGQTLEERAKNSPGAMTLNSV